MEKIRVSELQEIDEKVEVTLTTGEKVVGYFDCAFPLEYTDDEENLIDFEMCIHFICEYPEKYEFMIKENEIANYKILEG